MLLHEVIKVTCRQRQQRFRKKRKIYEDVYIVLKKLKLNARKNNLNSWNVLLLGMDTMSRMRAYRSIPKTIKYFKKNNWLDYRGFLKVNYIPSRYQKKLYHNPSAEKKTLTVRVLNSKTRCSRHRRNLFYFYFSILSAVR